MADKQSISLTGKAFIILFASYALVFLYNLWTEGFANVWFWKLTITYAVLVVVLALVYLIRREFGDDEQMKKDKFMD